MDDVSSISGIKSITPGTLVAMVEDNVRHHENILSGYQASDLRAYGRKLALMQDIICSLGELPNTPIRQIELESQVRHALAERQNALTKAQRQLDAVEQEIGQLLDEFRALVRQREQRLAQTWRDHLQQPVFAELIQQREELAESHARLNDSLTRIAEERDRKMPAYEGNPFYVHLRTRRYATDDYARRGLLRQFDDWLARKVNYRENRRNELILRSMPDSVGRLLDGYTARIQALEEQNNANWEAAIGLLRGDASVLRKSLLAKQIIAAKLRANSAYEELEAFIDGEDEYAHDIDQWLGTQLRQRDLYDVLEKLIEQHPDDRDGFDRHWEALNAINEQLDSLDESAEQAMDDYLHAKELEWGLRELRAAEATCEATCTCACHDPEGREGQCPCLYNDERYYSYPASLDCAGLISSYMKRNLTVDDLKDLFDNQRQTFADDVPAQTPTAVEATRNHTHS